MKLELKHLAPYFQHGLKCKANHLFGELIAIKKRKDGNCFIWFECETMTLQEELSRIKPILRPLSQLTQEITHKGETFVPLERLEKTIDMGVYMVTSTDGKVSMWQYEEYQMLFEWHFDLYGLIENGLAISIEDLTTEI